MNGGWTRVGAVRVCPRSAEEPGGSPPGGDLTAGLAVACGPGVLMASGDRGTWLSLADLLDDEGDASAAVGRSPQAPLLVVVTGGAGLDASGVGELFAVLVVDGGPVRVEGTIVHGAVFATGALDVGSTGRILFCQRGAAVGRDRSLNRVRLVPGTRWEVTD